MEADQSMAEANRILAEAGWRPIANPVWGDTFTAGRLVGGVAPDGTQYVKALDAVKPGDPRYGPDTPDEHHEAAAWLVAHAGPRLVLTPEREIALAVDGEGSEDEARLDNRLVSGDGGSDESGEENLASEPAPEAGFAFEPDPIDADFTESAGDAYDEAVTLALEGPQAGELPELDYAPEDFAPDEPPAAAGPIAYAASDFDALVREKLGRVSQIARGLKLTLQEGWTLDEFASLQNLIVRIDRQEATDDRTARARFQAISERSQAMSRVDSHRDALEADLEAIGVRRDYAAAVGFDPENGWPGGVQ